MFNFSLTIKGIISYKKLRKKLLFFKVQIKICFFFCSIHLTQLLVRSQSFFNRQKKNRQNSCDNLELLLWDFLILSMFKKHLFKSRILFRKVFLKKKIFCALTLSFGLRLSVLFHICSDQNNVLCDFLVFLRT